MSTTNCSKQLIQHKQKLLSTESIRRPSTTEQNISIIA